MKKTIFLSLVAGAMIFTGCGGGGGSTSTSGGSTSGGSTSGGSTSGGSTSGGSTSGGSTSGGARTYTKFTYPAGTLGTANLITMGQNNLWIVNPDTRTAGASALDKTYAQALQFCSDRNLTLPTAKDLLTTTLRPNDGTTAAWAAGKYVTFFSDNIIGQSADQEATTLRKVFCMDGVSVEKKHTTNSVDVSLDENNATTPLQGVEDIVTGLQWTPIHTYDKDIINPGHANEARFPMDSATAPQITAEAYCQKFGAGWRLPTLAELRTITYLDGTTGIPDPENLKPTVIWTSTLGANPGTYYAVHLNPNSNPSIPYYSEAPEDGTDSYFVTCVND